MPLILACWVSGIGEAESQYGCHPSRRHASVFAGPKCDGALRLVVADFRRGQWWAPLTEKLTGNQLTQKLAYLRLTRKTNNCRQPQHGRGSYGGCVVEINDLTGLSALCNDK